eukprot:jgi/Mesen1/7607/ME000395S06751
MAGGKTELATFAAGCFWGVELAFQRVPGVVKGNDVGTQYRAGAYFHTPEQERLARAAFDAEQARIGHKIMTELKPAGKFWPAEEYHQQYLEKGGRSSRKQSAAKGCSDPIRCYG